MTITNIIYTIIFICITISLLSTIFTKYIVGKYSGYTSGLKITSQEFIKMFIKDNNLKDVDCKYIEGECNDYYDLSSSTVNLSDVSYNKNTVSALAIAGHECGHILQNKKHSLFLKIRYKLFYYVIAFCYLATVVMALSYILDYSQITSYAAYVLAAGLIFQFLTFPIEIDASRKAMKYLKNKNLDKKELFAIGTILFSAALSYLDIIFLNIINMFKLTWNNESRYSLLSFHNFFK